MITVCVTHKESEETSPTTKPQTNPQPQSAGTAPPSPIPVCQGSSVAHSGSDLRAGYKLHVFELIMGQNKNGKRRLAAQSHIK